MNKVDQEAETARYKFRLVGGKNWKLLRKKFKLSLDQINEVDGKCRTIQDLNLYVRMMKAVHGEKTTAEEVIRKHQKDIEEIKDISITLYNQLVGYINFTQQLITSNLWLQCQNLAQQDEIGQLKKQVREIKEDIEKQKEEAIKSLKWKITGSESKHKMILINNEQNACLERFQGGEVLKQTGQNSCQIQGDIVKHSKLISSLALDACKQISGHAKFRAIIMDYPWQNTGFTMPYKTISETKMGEAINFDELQDYGLVFCWVSNKTDTFTIEHMVKQGYKKIEIVTWVKLKKSGDVLNRIGYYMLHSTEQCIVFMKKGKDQRVGDFLNLRKTNNVIITCPDPKASHKPYQFYDYVEAMVKDKSFLDLFARVHNKRIGWVGIGDEAIFFNPEYQRQALEKRRRIKERRKEIERQKRESNEGLK